MSEKKKKKNVVFDLPEDIIVKILCRLPVKTLIRFTCVSKRWRSIISSDPQFAKSQLNLASQQKALCHRFLVCILSLLEAHIQCRCDFLDSSVKKAALSQLHTKFRTLDLEAPTQFGNASSVKILSSPFDGLVRPMATCNGLVILGDVHCTNLSIWNPSTAFFRKIPDPGIWAKMTTKNGNRRWAVFVCCGFGYVSATDDYKFVILLHDLPFLLGVHIFSVRDNSWKIVQVPGIHDDWIFSSKGVLSNEVLHWITENRTNELVISAFDLAEEEFQKESLLFPADVDCNIYDPDYNIRDPWKRIELGCLDGCLCIHSLNTKAGGDIEVWVMREYRVLESWIKLSKFSVDDIPGVFVSQIPLFQFFVSESGTAFINSDFKELVRIECHKEEKPVLSGQYKIEKWEPLNLGLWEQILESFRKEKEDANFFSVMFYDETLVSVPE